MPQKKTSRAICVSAVLIFHWSGMYDMYSTRAQVANTLVIPRWRQWACIKSAYAQPLFETKILSRFMLRAKPHVSCRPLWLKHKWTLWEITQEQKLKQSLGAIKYVCADCTRFSVCFCSKSFVDFFETFSEEDHSLILDQVMNKVPYESYMAGGLC